MNIRPLSSELQKIANKELNEDSNRTKEAYDHIKEWLRKQPHLNIQIDDQILVAFFRGCKWNHHQVKNKIDNFYSIRSFAPELFGNRDPRSIEIQKVLNSRIIFLLPNQKDYLGPRIFMMIMGNANVNETPLAQILKVMLMSIEILMKEDDNFVISGVSVIVDYHRYDKSFMLQYTPTIVKKYVTCFQNCYPTRIKGYTVLNAPTVYDIIYNICKHILTEKIKNRFIILNASKTSNYLKEFNKSLLPEEYGGCNESVKILADNWKSKVESNRDWFLEDQKNMSNEKLRLGKSKLSHDDFGVDGTFRKLVID